MLYRELQREILQLAEKWSVISVTGPRQSGKTTLCKLTFPDYDYVNLEDSTMRLDLEQNYHSYLRSHTKLIIDEAQLLPELFSAIQVAVDEDKTRRYVLSGSSDFLLMRSITQSLAGRVAVLRLLPLSIRELGVTGQTVPTDELLFKGFYPAIWGDGFSPKSVYESYITTYIERDVRQIVNIKNLELFRKFITICAARVGQEFNASAISGEIGMSYTTIQEWFRILQASYTAFELPPFFRNIGKRLVKTSKIYFYDVGLVCYLLGIERPEYLEHHPLRGSIFENMVVVEMLKSRFNSGRRSNLFFYRDKGQHEVDIIQEFGNEMRAYEIKSATQIHPDFYRNLKYFKKLNGDTVLSTQVIYDGEREFDIPDEGYLNYRHWKEDNPWIKQ